MRVLVLQRPASAAPFEHWLREAGDDIEVRIVTGVDTVRGDESIAPGTRREILDDYEAEATTKRIIEISAEWRPDVVFSNAESDVLRAAETRTLLGIPGMKSSSAILFRDKVLMKRLFRGLSIEPVEHRVPASVSDVLDACVELGPVVLKPRDGAGSVGVHVLATPAEVIEHFTIQPGLLGPLHQSRLIAEPFVAGDVYHVDVLVRDTEPILVSPSKYLAPPHLFREKNVGSVMTDVSSDDHRILVGYAEELTAGIAAEHQPHIMHLEVYKTPGGRFLAGEVACRGGGGLIKESMRHTYGVDQAWATCLLSAGLLPRRTYRERIGPQTGWVLETAVPLNLDLNAPPEWVRVWESKTRPEASRSSVDAGIQVTVEGDSHAQIVDRIATLHADPVASRSGARATSTACPQLHPVTR
jgi:hypothetical protein